MEGRMKNGEDCRPLTPHRSLRSFPTWTWLGFHVFWTMYYFRTSGYRILFFKLLFWCTEPGNKGKHRCNQSNHTVLKTWGAIRSKATGFGSNFFFFFLVKHVFGVLNFTGACLNLYLVVSRYMRYYSTC